MPLLKCASSENDQADTTSLGFMKKCPFQLKMTYTYFFYKKPVYKKPRTRCPQIAPNLRNFKNYKRNGILT